MQQPVRSAARQVARANHAQREIYDLSGSLPIPRHDLVANPCIGLSARPGPVLRMQ